MASEGNPPATAKRLGMPWRLLALCFLLNLYSILRQSC